MIQSSSTELAEAEQRLIVEDAKLRSGTVNHFEVSRGRFWDVEDTRDYLLARMAVVNCLRKIGSQAHLKLGLSHCLELLPLCRNDRIGLRNEIPTFMLRLGQDQDCYDFIKWWTTKFVDFSHDWVNGEQAPWTLQHEDAYEEITAVFTKLTDGDSEDLDIHHLVNMTLLKIKLLLDVQARQTHTRASNSDTTSEYTSAISAARIDSLDVGDLEKVSLRLQSQIKTLYEAVMDGNNFLWGLFLHVTPSTLTGPLVYPFGVGSKSEAMLMVRLYKKAWDDVQGAMDIMRLQAGA